MAVIIMVEHFHDHRSVYLAGYESDLSKLCNSEELFLLVLMLCTIYQANPLDSLDKLGCFVLLYRARIDLRAPFRVLFFVFAKFLARMETERYAFRAEFLPRYVLVSVDFASRLRIRYEKEGISTNLSRKLTFDNFFHLIEYNLYTQI